MSRINTDSGDDDRGPEGSRNAAEETPTDADVEAIQAHLCRRSAAAPTDDPPDDHPMTI
jgi:hypothetical protein